jgi:hypothetical protein
VWNNDHVGDLDDLDDVSAAGPTTGDHLEWNGSAWVPAAVDDQIAAALATDTPLYRVVMRPGITDPPEPVSNVWGDGYVYAKAVDD